MSISIPTIRTALKTRLEASGITGINVADYEDFQLPQMPCATIVMRSGNVGELYDQQFGFGDITFIVRNYRALDGSARVADTNLDADIASILSILGADRTLGGKVIDTIVNSVQRFYDVDSGKPKYVWAEWDITIIPFANAG
jgi:hypothetical protein